ncbi:O-antigen ligase family protein [Psychrosphaera sp.]|nr:O-antigen ligase family protein [Psychrosphaera sp.]
MNKIENTQTQEVKNSGLAFFFLMLYTASVLIRPHEMFIGTLDWMVIRVFAILCFIFILFGQRPLKLHPQHWMLLGLLPLIIISGFLNGSGMVGITHTQSFFVSCLIPMFLFSCCLTSIKRQQIIMVICMIAALTMVHNGHVQQSAPGGYGWALFTHSVGYIDLGERRITYLGFFNDPNDIGMFLVMNIPFVMYFYYRGAFLQKVLMMTVLVALLYGVYITGSRGTALGVGGLLGVYFLVANAGPKLFIASLIIAPIGATVVASLQSSIDASANGRLEAWYFGIQMLLSNPLFGIGKGRFIEEHDLVAHNSFVQVAAELGVLGYSLWGGCLIFTLLTGYLFIKQRQKTKDEETGEKLEAEVISEELQQELKLNKALFYSLVGFLITGFFLSRMYAVLLFIFIGMALASHVRVIKLNKQSECLAWPMAKKSMAYAWVIIIAVYFSLKLGL